MADDRVVGHYLKILREGILGRHYLLAANGFFLGIAVVAEDLKAFRVLVLNDPLVQIVTTPVTMLCCVLSTIISNVIYTEYVQVSLATPSASAFSISQYVDNRFLHRLCVSLVVPSSYTLHLFPKNRAETLLAAILPLIGFLLVNIRMRHVLPSYDR